MKGVFKMEERFIEFMKNNGLSKNTYESYASDIKFFKQYYFDSYGEELHELIRGDVRQYFDFLKRSSCPTTINRKISALKQYNLFLIDESFFSFAKTLVLFFIVLSVAITTDSPCKA